MQPVSAKGSDPQALDPAYWPTRPSHGAAAVRRYAFRRRGEPVGSRRERDQLGRRANWFAVGVGAVGGAAALIQLRQQGQTLKGEIERNKRRDDLPDGQLKDLRDRADARSREQAEDIRVEWYPNRTWVTVVNKSSRPITRIRAQIRYRCPMVGSKSIASTCGT